MSLSLRASLAGSDEHLGDRASALVDEALSPREHERLLSHVARCPACHAVVDGERAAKVLVSRLAHPEMGVALTAALLTLPGMAGSGPATDVPSLPPGGLPVAVPAARPPRSTARGLVGWSGAGATAAAVLLVGATAAPATAVLPVAVSTRAVASVSTTVPSTMPTTVQTTVQTTVSTQVTGLPTVFQNAVRPAPTPPSIRPLAEVEVPGITR